jgi:hypothetical protein
LYFQDAVGTNSTYAASVDGGSTWATQMVGAGLDLNSIAWGPLDDVYGAGQTDLGEGFDFLLVPNLFPPDESPSSDGLLVKSTNNGVDWVKVNLNLQF